MRKKFLLLFLCFCFIGLFTTACGSKSSFKNANVGDYVQMGSYSQGATGDIQPIEWQVLAKEENRILVISRYGLESRRFDTRLNDWKNSEIRQWINNDFYNIAFNEKEKKYIMPFGSDNVFLLSKEDAEKYFVDDNARKCKPTEYAIKNGAMVSTGGYCSWWLRSSSFNYNIVYTIGNYEGSGSISEFYDIINDGIIVRPALWINL